MMNYVITFRVEVDRVIAEASELKSLNVQIESSVSREGGGAGNGEVNSIRVIVLQGFQIRTQIIRLQIFTCWIG